jgi:Mn2+/Fe2+ NRAMP family transporter
MVPAGLVSVAGVVGAPVLDRDGVRAGTLVDVVVRWSGAVHPPLAEALLRAGHRHTLVPAGSIIATAAAIGGSGALTSAARAAEALRPVAGPAAPALFDIGLLGASLLAAAVVPLSSAYAIAEAAGAERSISASFRQAPLFSGLFTVQLVVGAGAALAPGNLVSLVVNMQVLNGLCVAAIAALALTVPVLNVAGAS